MRNQIIIQLYIVILNSIENIIKYNIFITSQQHCHDEIIDLVTFVFDHGCVKRLNVKYYVKSWEPLLTRPCLPEWYLTGLVGGHKKWLKWLVAGTRNVYHWPSPWTPRSLSCKYFFRVALYSFILRKNTHINKLRGSQYRIDRSVFMRIPVSSLSTSDIYL